MALILPRIGSWPQGFTYVAEVKTFIGVVCAPIVDGLMFPTLRPEKFKDYVFFHTARQAWEDRKYEIKVVPETWCRAALPLARVKAQVPKSLSGLLSPTSPLLSYISYLPQNIFFSPSRYSL